MAFDQLFHLILHEIDRFGCFMLKSGFLSKSLVLCLNQTVSRHQILGGVGVRVMHSKSDAPSSIPTHSLLNCFFLKN